MKFLFFLFFLVLFVSVFSSTSLVGAVSFSPTSLIFEQSIGEESCQTIVIGLDSDSTISDQWAENENVEWKVSAFDTDADSHGISINYSSGVSQSEDEIEVCLSGDELGEYHGVIVMEQEQEGNSIIQMGVWLKVIISEHQSSENMGNSGGSSSTSSASTLKQNKSETTNLNQNNQEEIQTENEETSLEDEKTIGITGGVIGVLKNNSGKTIIVVLFVLALSGLLIHNIRRKKL